MYLGVVAVAVMSPDQKECAITLDQNPLATWVELPESHSHLYYSNILCGVIRGALEMVWPAACSAISTFTQTPPGAPEGRSQVCPRCALRRRDDRDPSEAD